MVKTTIKVNGEDFELVKNELYIIEFNYPDIEPTNPFEFLGQPNNINDFIFIGTHYNYAVNFRKDSIKSIKKYEEAGEKVEETSELGYLLIRFFTNLKNILTQ